MPSIPSFSHPDPGNHTSLSYPLLQFNNPDFRMACTTLFSLTVHPSYHIMLGDLAAVGLHDKILGMLNTVQWENFMRIEEPIFHELFLEFLSTFTLNSSDPVNYTEQRVMSFQLGGKQFNFSLNAFAVHCGFYDALFVTICTFDHALSIHELVHYHQYWLKIIHAGAA